MSIADLNYSLKNDIAIKVEFPEYYPNFPHAMNENYNCELISRFDKEFTKQFCNNGSNMDITLPDGLHWNALVYPNTTEDKLKTVAVLTTVLFFIDDCVEYTFGDVGRSAEKAKPFAEMICRLIDNISDIRKIPINEIQKWKPFMFALYSCMYAIREQTGTTFWNYFSNAVKDFTKSLIDECMIDDQNYEEADILEFRVNNSGGMPMLFLIQYADGIELTDKELNNQLLHDVLKCAVKSMQMCNDLYSFRKEIKECNGMLQTSKNMIAILMRTQSLSLQEAFDKQVVIIKKLDELYIKAKQILFDSKPSQQISRLCVALEYFFGGNWIYHLGAKRYNGANFKGCIPSNGKWIYSPHQTIIIAANNCENKFEKFQKYFNF